MKDLTKQKCVPCKAGAPPLNKSEIQQYLQETHGWEFLDGEPQKIKCKFTFKDFKEALDFINKVGELAQSENHHPDIFLYNYKKVDITLSTHAIGGLSSNDFIMAAKINNLESLLERLRP